MRKIFFLMLCFIAFSFVSCASPGKTGISIDSKTDFGITVMDGDKEVAKTTCSSGIKYRSETGELFVIEDCVAYIQTEEGIYRCSVAMGLDQLPISRKIDIKENCNIDVKVRKVLGQEG